MLRNLVDMANDISHNERLHLIVNYLHGDETLHIQVKLEYIYLANIEEYNQLYFPISSGEKKNTKTQLHNTIHILI